MKIGIDCSACGTEHNLFDGCGTSSTKTYLRCSKCENITVIEAENITSGFNEDTDHIDNLVEGHQLISDCLKKNRKRIVELEEELNKYRSLLDDAAKIELERNNYRSLSNTYVMEIQELKDEIKELKSQISDLEYDLEKTNNELDKYESCEDDIDDLKQEVRVLENKLENTSIPELEFDHINGAYLRTTFTNNIYGVIR